MSFADPEALRITTSMILPGFIALYFRSQFLSGRAGSGTEAVLSYLAISSVYWSIIFLAGIPTQIISESKALALALLIVGPAIFGCLLGINARHEFIRKILRKARLNTTHTTATAWDYKFTKTDSCFVIVTLNNGEQFSGYFGPQSFASSEPSERDLLLEKIYIISDDGEWTELQGKEALIRSSEIRYVEFCKDTEGKSDDRQETTNTNDR